MSLATAPVQASSWVETANSQPVQERFVVILGDQIERNHPPSSKAPALARLSAVRKLRHMFRYEPGWDGEHALQPNRAAINQAIDFIDRLVPDVSFKVAADPTGAILLELDDPSRDIILAFEGTPEVVLYHRRNGRFEHTIYPWPRKSRIPHALSAAFRS